jgi:hypothetical protein
MKFIGILLTYEPDFVLDEIGEAKLSFYRENFAAYSEARDNLDDVYLYLVDAGSSSEFVEALDSLTSDFDIRVVIVGHHLSSTDAFNYCVSKVRDVNSIYVWLASDTRPLNTNWWRVLYIDMVQSNADVLYPAVTMDGSSSTTQTQSTPIDKDPEDVCFPNFCNTICMAIKGDLLGEVGWRLPDKYKANGNCKGISLLAFGLERKMVISFRAFLEHRQTFQYKHNWTNDKKRDFRELEYLKLSILESGLCAYGFSVWRFKDYFGLRRKYGKNIFVILFGYFRMLFLFVASKDFREKITTQIALSLLADRNSRRLMRYEKSQRIEIIKEIYWE